MCVCVCVCVCVLDVHVCCDVGGWVVGGQMYSKMAAIVFISYMYPTDLFLWSPCVHGLSE